MAFLLFTTAYLMHLTADTHGSRGSHDVCPTCLPSFALTMRGKCEPITLTARINDLRVSVSCSQNGSRAKVRQFAGPRGVQEDILGFDVTVQDVMTVEVLEALQYVTCVVLHAL